MQNVDAAAPRRALPVWAMGLANCPTGFVYGFISTAMGILLAARHVSAGQVGAISGVAFSPTFWAWLLAPVLDVHFTKRFYGFLFAGLAAVLLGATVLSLGNLAWFTGLLTASCACVVLYSNAVQGWAPDAVADADYDAMSGWLNVANLGAAGVFSVLTVVLVRTAASPVAALCLAALVFAPTALLLFFPAPPQPEGTLRANFAAMRRSLARVLREGRVWIGLALFVAPVASFALTNIFSALGADFGVGERAVTSLNGLGVAAVCSLGCLLAIPVCGRLRRRSVYLLAGVAGAVIAAAMGVLPHTLMVYAVGLLAYNFFQGFTYTAFTALELEIIGPRNALSGTMIAMLSASCNVPISGMTVLEGHLHDVHGLRAMFFTDAGGAAIAVVLLALVVLPLLDRWVRRADARALTRTP
jgi:PAT family beta-lactamase induction signal transducer AmpG